MQNDRELFDNFNNTTYSLYTTLKCYLQCKFFILDITVIYLEL